MLAQFFSRNATDVRAMLPMIRDASGLLARLLEGGTVELPAGWPACFATAGGTV